MQSWVRRVLGIGLVAGLGAALVPGPALAGGTDEVLIDFGSPESTVTSYSWFYAQASPA